MTMKNYKNYKVQEWKDRINISFFIVRYSLNKELSKFVEKWYNEIDTKGIIIEPEEKEFWK